MKKIYEKYMFVVGCLGSGLFYAQAIEILNDKSSANVSLFGFSLGLISVVSWLIYGIQIKDKVLIFSNLLATIGASLVIIAIVIYP